MCARDDVTVNARAMLRCRLAWDERVGLMELWEQWHPAADSGRQPSARALLARRYFYAGVSGKTKAGEPLMVERLGRADLSGIAREGTACQELILQGYMMYLHATAVSCCSQLAPLFDLLPLRAFKPPLQASLHTST